LDVAALSLFDEAVDRVEEPLPADETFGLAGDKRGEVENATPDFGWCWFLFRLIESRGVTQGDPAVGVSVDGVGEPGGMTGVGRSNGKTCGARGLAEGLSLCEGFVKRLRERQRQRVPHRPCRTDEGSRAADAHPPVRPAAKAGQRPCLLPDPAGVEEDEGAILADLCRNRSRQVAGSEGALVDQRQGGLVRLFLVEGA